MADSPIENLSNAEISEFKRLIAHEYLEARLMEYGINFRSLVNSSNMYFYDNGAHWLSVSWDSGGKLFYPDIGILQYPNYPNIIDFNNLEEIISHYIDLFNLSL